MGSCGTADGDGLTNGQEAQLGFNPTKVDTDGDGYTDWAEYIAGTSGTEEDDYLALRVAPESDGEGRAIFSWHSETGRVYSVLFTTNLTGLWLATPLHVVHGDGADKAFTNENDVDILGFFCLEVERE